MADKSHIEWTDATWNPVTGCTVLSPGCANCYAMKLAGTRLRNHPSRKGLTTESKAGPVWNGQVRFNEQWLLQPLGWKKPRMIFVCAHGDLFHEDVPDAWIDLVFKVMAMASRHTFQVLTKRAGRMRAYVNQARDRIIARTEDGHPHIGIETDKHFRCMTKIGGELPWPLPNVWLGVSAERQKEANERVPLLLDTPAAVRFVSLEPLIGPVSLDALAMPAGWETCDCEEHRPTFNALSGSVFCAGCCEGAEAVNTDRIGWVIVGGESGPDARSMHPQWARDLRDQCDAADVPFFFKQWGNWAPSSPEQARGNPRSGWCALSGNRPPKREELYPTAGAEFVEHMTKVAAGRYLDGVLHDAMPAVLS